VSHGTNGSGSPVTGKLLEGLQSIAGAMADKAMASVNERMGGLTDRLTEYAGGGDGAGKEAIAKGMEGLQQGDSPVKALAGAGVAGGKEQVKQAFGKGGGKKSGGKNSLKVTNIVESIEVGVPVSVAYNQWTEFKSFPSFMKKVEDIDQESSEKMKWKAQVFWSHRTWESTITEQVPDERIVWTSKGEKGSVDGTVTYEERSAPEADAHVVGPERAWVEAFGVDGSRTELEFTGDTRLAEALIDEVVAGVARSRAVA